jgi:glycosyltransferase involved in cell wall biosynthesis
VKVAEALAYGKAVVASPRAVEGLAVEPDVHLAVADTDDEFAARIVELLDGDAERRRLLGANAFSWAQRHLSTERWASEYTALYDRLLNAPA